MNEKPRPAPSARSEHRADYNRVVARYYDAAYASMPSLGPDIGFYRALAEEKGGPALELGCGTGRVLLEIAKHGLPAVGLDSSEGMLQILRQKSGAERLELVRSQMQDFDLGGRRFALVYSAFRAFQHLYDVEEQLACLGAVLRHLVRGGTFAFDVFCPRLDTIGTLEEPEKADLRFAQGADNVTRFVQTRRDPALQIATVDMRFERSRDGAVLSSETERIHLRWFWRYELEHLLVRAGFSTVAVYGGFDRSPVRATSGDYVVVATAP